MIMRDDNNISMYKEHYDVSKNNGVNLNETDLFVYHVLKKQLDNDRPLFINDTT